MSNDFKEENSILVATIKRDGSGWVFVADGEGYVISDLNTIVSHLSGTGVA